MRNYFMNQLFSECDFLTFLPPSWWQKGIILRSRWERWFFKYKTALSHWRIESFSMPTYMQMFLFHSRRPMIFRRDFLCVIKMMVHRGPVSVAKQVKKVKTYNIFSRIHSEHWSLSSTLLFMKRSKFNIFSWALYSLEVENKLF